MKEDRLQAFWTATMVTKRYAFLWIEMAPERSIQSNDERLMPTKHLVSSYYRLGGGGQADFQPDDFFYSKSDRSSLK
jgi:hypothetical protein